MDRLFQLPQPASSHAKTLSAAPEDARERDDAIAAVAMSTPAVADRDEQVRREGRDFAAQTKTITRAGYGRFATWGLGSAVLTLALGPAVGLLFAAVAIASSPYRRRV